MRWLVVVLALSVGCKPPIPPSNGVDPAVGFNAGLAAVSDGNLAVAYSAFARSAELSGGHRAHYNAGLASERLGEPERAMAHFRAALDADPAYVNAAIRLAGMLEPADSVALLRGFLEGSPAATAVRIKLAGALARLGDEDGSREQAAIVLRGNPESVDLYRELASAYLERGATSLGQLYAARARELGGDDAGLLNDAGVRLLEEGSTVEAVTRFQHALSLRPGDIPANLNLGWVALRSGDHQQAAKRFRRALQEDPELVDARLGVAIAAGLAGDRKLAKRVYRGILQDDPTNHVAEENLLLLIASEKPPVADVYLKRLREDIELLSGQVAELRAIMASNSCLDEGVAAEHDLVLETAEELLALESEEGNDEARVVLGAYADEIRGACP